MTIDEEKGAAIRIIDGDVTSDVTVDSLLRHGSLIGGGAVAVGRRGDTVPVSAVFETKRPWVTVASADGGYRATIPSTALHEGGLLLVGTAAEPLADAEGGPVRLIVSEGDTLCWNVKNVATMAATDEPLPDSVPLNPPH